MDSLKVEAGVVVARISSFVANCSRWVRLKRYSLLDIISHHYLCRNSFNAGANSQTQLATDPEALKLQSLDRRLNSVNAVLQPLLQSLNEERNSYTPFLKLPDDILLSLWERLSIKESLSLSRGSRRLRRVALANGRLWSYLDVSRIDPKKFRALVERSREAALTILVMERNIKWKNTPSSGSYGNTNLPMIEWDEVTLEEVDKVLVRAKVADLYLGQRSAENNLYCTPWTLDQPLPLLRALSVTQRARSDRALPNDDPLPFPLAKGFISLDHFSVSCLSMNWTDPVLQNLVSLNISNCPNPPGPDQLYTILRACPKIEFFSFVGRLTAGQPMLRPKEDYAPLALARLRDVKWEDRTRESDAFENLFRLIVPGSPRLRCSFRLTDYSALASPGDIPLLSLLLPTINRLRMRFQQGPNSEGTYLVALAPDHSHFAITIWAVRPVGSHTGTFTLHDAEILKGLGDDLFPWHQIEVLELTGSIPPTHYAKIFRRCTSLRNLILSAVPTEPIAFGFEFCSLAHLESVEMVYSLENYPPLLSTLQLRSSPTSYGHPKLRQLILHTPHDPPDRNELAKLEALRQVTDLLRVIQYPISLGRLDRPMARVSNNANYSARDRRLAEVPHSIPEDVGPIPHEVGPSQPSVFQWWSNN